MSRCGASPPKYPVRFDGRGWSVAKAVIAIAVTAATVAYLAHTFLRSWDAFTNVVTDLDVLLAAGLLSVAYGACFFILFGSWFLTLRHDAASPVRAARGAYIYCIANAAKYLPGSVFHFAGRQVLGARAGWRHGAIAQATLLEIVATVAAILLLLSLAAAAGPASAIESLLPEAWGSTAAHGRFLGVATLVAGCVIFALSARFGLFVQLFGASPNAVARAIALCTAFFAVYATLTMIFAQCLPSDEYGLPLPAVGAAYLIAWLCGFAVPGAPGGLGVREAVLVLVLTGPAVGDPAFALALGFGMRLVSILGDVVAIAIAWAFYRLADRNDAARDRSTEWT